MIMRTMSMLACVAILAAVAPSALSQVKDLETEALRTEIAAGKHDDLVGYYHAGTTVISVTREGKQIFAQAGESGAFMELQPKAGGGFTAMEGRAQVTFSKDAAGKVSSFTLRQGTSEQVGRRITAEQAAKIKADLAERIARNQPVAGSEEMLRKHIEGMREGKPVYELMTPSLIAVIKPQAQLGKMRLAQVGAIQKIAFTGVAPNGLDTFRVEYENGSSNYLIGLTSDGKIAALGVQPGQ
jgi:hypothetical protein